MIEAVTFRREPNHSSVSDHPTTLRSRSNREANRLAIEAVRSLDAELVLLSDVTSLADFGCGARLDHRGLLEHVDALAVDIWPDEEENPGELPGGVPLDPCSGVPSWPAWITAVGVSSYDSEQQQATQLRRVLDLLRPRATRVYLYNLMDPPEVWSVASSSASPLSPHQRRGDHMGLLTADGRPKPASAVFDPALGICQWFHFEDPRLEAAADWLRDLGARRVHTAISWHDWQRPAALAWFDRMMTALNEFEVTLTLCVDPPDRANHTLGSGMTMNPGAFAYFAAEVVSRYALGVGLERRQPHREAWKAPAQHACADLYGGISG